MTHSQYPTRKEPEAPHSLEKAKEVMSDKELARFIELYEKVKGVNPFEIK